MQAQGGGQQVQQAQAAPVPFMIQTVAVCKLLTELIIENYIFMDHFE
jgi:hypothetical protein